MYRLRPPRGALSGLIPELMFLLLVLVLGLVCFCLSIYRIKDIYVVFLKDICSRSFF
jgi:hypothetical protein